MQKHGELVKIIQPTQGGNVLAIHYENYFSINVDVLKSLFLNKEISRVETGYIMEMATMLKTEYNALFQGNNFPHNIGTLSYTLDMSYNKMSSLLKKLVKKGILGKLSTEDRELYVMNPFLARRRKWVDQETSKIFNDFSTKYSPKGELNSDI